MFYDALRSDYNTPLSEIPVIASLSPDYSYSFVLQHPENHLVFHIKRPAIVLVAIFAIGELKFEGLYGIMSIPQSDFGKIIPELPNLTGIIDVPEIVPLTSFDDFHHGTRKGIMITHLPTGKRTKIESPEYLKLKELRGNHPNLFYQYLSLVRMNTLHDFLHHFPMYREMFCRFYKQYHQFINDVHKAYVSQYVLKNVVEPIPKKYAIHATRIHHNVYIPSLVNGRKVVIKQWIVQQYFDKMEPREVLYALNYTTDN